MPNRPPDAGRDDDKQVEGTPALSPNSVPQLGGNPFESKQEVAQPSVKGMDSAEESFTCPVSSAQVPPCWFECLRHSVKPAVGN
jgi:hypothetical protein